MGWNEEILYFTGDEFFTALLEALRNATKSITAEVYIFAKDELGERVAAACIDAARRGVSVRIIVDGVGSPAFRSQYGERLRDAGIRYRIFHRPPWEFLFGFSAPGWIRSRLLRFLQRVNRRNHRKVFIIDGVQAFVGGMNVWDVHCASLVGAEAWRDTSAAVRGPSMYLLQDSFELHWGGNLGRLKRIIARARSRAARQEYARSIRERRENTDVIVNTLRRDRYSHMGKLITQLESAQECVLLTNGYFVPPRALVRALSATARRGVEVKCMLAGISDIAFMPWVARTYYRTLLESGVIIYEYQPSVLHAKTLVVDGVAIVGSSNFNHRSLLHDVEADVMLRSKKSIQKMKDQFAEDITKASQVTEETLRAIPLVQRCLAGVFFVVRWVL